jgi:hypothetical protein
MKSTNDPMYQRIIDNHVLIYGNGLKEGFVSQ